MKHRLPSYLHTLRKQRGLSQSDIASLLAITGSALSRFEKRSRKPTAELIIATEVLFGHTAKEIFPAFYHAVEHEIVRRAKIELRQLKEGKAASKTRVQFLTELIDRASQTHLDV